MKTTEKVQNFNDDLSISLSEVRAVLDHWNLKDWQEYLLVRRPGHPNSYIVFANPSDTSGFEERLMRFHKEQAVQETLRTSADSGDRIDAEP